MAGFTRVSGDYKPVANFDAPTYTNTGVNEVTSAATVQPQGPKLEFFTVTGTGALSLAQINVIIQTTQQLATVYIYEYTDAANDTLAMAVYPVAAWTAATLEAAIDAALTAADIANNTSVAASATFTG